MYWLLLSNSFLAIKSIFFYLRGVNPYSPSFPQKKIEIAAFYLYCRIFRVKTEAILVLFLLILGNYRQKEIGEFMLVVTSTNSPTYQILLAYGSLRTEKTRPTRTKYSTAYAATPTMNPMLENPCPGKTANMSIMTTVISPTMPTIGAPQVPPLCSRLRPIL